MGSFKSCVGKLKKAGYDTSAFDSKSMAAMEATGELNPFIDKQLGELRTSYEELGATRVRLMDAVAEMSPELSEIIKEHRRDEISLNRPKGSSKRNPAGLAAKNPPQGPKSDRNELGLPKKTRKADPPKLEKLGKAVQTERKAISTEETAAAVAKSLKKLRVLNGAKDYSELAPSTAMKKAKEAGEMESIREMFPEETSNLGAIKQFLKVAKNQIEKEKAPPPAPFAPRQEKQLGDYNQTIIEQRKYEPEETKKESSPDAVLEGVTELEPNTIEHTIPLRKNKKGERTEIVGVVGIAQRLKSFFPGATLFRTPHPTAAGQNLYTIRQENVEEGTYDGSPQEMLSAVAKLLEDGKTMPKELQDEKGNYYPNPAYLVLVDSKTGVRVPVDAVGVTKLGAVIDQQTNDGGMTAKQKSFRQFNAGLAFLLTEGNLELEPTAEKPVAEKKPVEVANEPDVEMEVWFGTNQHADLSNLWGRPFKLNNRDYLSVEHAYQTLKGGVFDPVTYEAYKKAPIGRKIVGKNKADTNTNVALMHKLVYESFRQNPAAAEQLVATGNATFTHKRDRGIWKKEFPAALMAARERLRDPDADTDTSKTEEQQKQERIEKIDTTKDPGVRKFLAELTLDTLMSLKGVSWMTAEDIKEYPNANGLAKTSQGIIRFSQAKAQGTTIKLQRVVYHEAGHIVDSELNFVPRNSVTAQMIAEAYIMAHTDGHVLKPLLDKIFTNYPEKSWTAEIIAQMFYAHRKNPSKLKAAWPEMFELMEHMNDELRRKREVIAEGQEARKRIDRKRASKNAGAQSSESPAQKAEPSGEQSKAVNSSSEKPVARVDPNTVIDTRGTTLAEAQESYIPQPGMLSRRKQAEIRKEVHIRLLKEAEKKRKAALLRGEKKKIPGPTKEEIDAATEKEIIKQGEALLAAKESEFDPSDTQLRETMATQVKEKLVREVDEKFIPKPGLKREITITEDPDPGDVSKFEKEEAQNARSTGKAKTHKELTGATLPNNQAAPDAAAAKAVFNTFSQSDVIGSLPQRFVEFTKSLFGLLGIKTKVIFVDKAGAQQLLKAEGLPPQWRSNLQNVLKDAPAGRLMLSDSSVATERFAIVYVDSSLDPATQLATVVHELGHIVQLAKLDAAPQAVQDALKAAYENSGSQIEFEEWFANQLLKWVGVTTAPKNMIDKFFKDLAFALRKLWARFKPDSTYEEFMNTLVVANATKGGIKIEAGKTGKWRKAWVDDLAGIADSPYLDPKPRAYYDMTPDAPHTHPGFRLRARQLLAWGKQGWSVAGDIMSPFHTMVTQSADAYLRGNNLGWLADAFHKRPDVRYGRTTPVSIEVQQRLDHGQFVPEIEAIIALMPRGQRLNQIDSESPVYKQAVRELIDQSDNPSELAQAIRDYFVSVERYLNRNGVMFRTRQKYFPIMLDRYRWGANRERVVEIAMRDLGKTREEAEAMFNSVANDPHVLFDLSAEYDPRTAGTFSHANSRNFGPREHKAFEEFINTDLMSVVMNYTHSATKHVAIRAAFGAPMGNVRGAVQVDPLAQLKTDLTRAVNRGDITPEVYDRVWNTVLPGLFGQLGANMNPGARKLQSWVIFLQNVRLLGTALLASFVDVAGVNYRAGGAQGKWDSIKEAMSAMRDKDKQLFYRTIGLIRDDMTETIMNDPTHTQFLDPKVRRLNETFFRWNGMQGWTNFSRIYAFTMGKRFILENAHRNDAYGNKRLRELGLNRLDVLQWENEGATMDLNEHYNIAVALHQFTDEAILRPNASMRPSWMSDQRWLLVSNLKSFIFTYHETILRRIWSQVKDGEFKQMANVIPLVGFFALALTMSMAGYELRRQLMHGFNPPEWAEKDALGYFTEGVQRAGMLGVMQFFVDSYEAENRGKMALMSMAGPTATWAEMFMTEDLSYTLERSLPIMAQSPALRAWVRETI